MPAERAEAAVAALREVEHRFPGLVEHIPAVTLVEVPDPSAATGSRTIYVSPQIQTVLGYTPQELIDDPDFLPRILHPADRERVLEEEARTGRTGEPFDLEYRVRAKDGRIVWIHARATLRTGEAGAPGFWLGVLLDVTERRRAEAADRANRAKSEFLSRMSHELRTPLNAILGFGQLLESAELAPEDADSVRQIVKAGRHLLDLINEVLDISRIEAGRLPLSIEPVRVEDVVRETLDLVSPAASERGVGLQADDVDPRLHVLADRQRLKQVLLNLLSNAIKYNRERGTVTVEASRDGTEGCRLVVRDTGPGIPSEDLERLFSPFDRLGAEAGGVEGAGLGLALTKTLVEAMGGRIDAHSEVGTGTAFSVWLPLVDAPEDAFARGAAPSHGIPGEEIATDGSRTILYVEDNLSNLRLIQRILARRPGVRLIAAMQGRMGLELAREHEPSLILLDLHLPDVPGEEVLRELRRAPETRAIPVVVTSADATPGRIDALRAAGTVEYLTKPLDVHRFLEIVDEHLTEADGPNLRAG